MRGLFAILVAHQFAFIALGYHGLRGCQRNAGGALAERMDVSWPSGEAGAVMIFCEMPLLPMLATS